tara:strand:+ start:1016 stop:1831 length:816 start_codon:yes stop_codon:yes gene_type:complete
MLPGSIGSKVTEIFKNTRQKVVDLSFSEKTPDHIQSCSSTILWDVGIAPGLSNMLVSSALKKYKVIEKVTIKVGGNPLQQDSEWSYMAPFSPHDVIAEYTRPARIIDDSVVTTVPAMSDLHTIDANGRVMEAFLTDGLRSLLNLDIENMGEYTVRWPGHIQRYQNTRMHPDDLVEAWKYNPSRGEFTWMEVEIQSKGRSVRWVVEDQGKDGDSSMARTTGLVTTCCVLAWADNPLLLDEGVYAPEDLPDSILEFVIETMRSEGVSIEKYEK